MITGLNKIKKVFKPKNLGGMGTNVPQVKSELEKLGYQVILDDYNNEYDILHMHVPLFNYFFLKAKKDGKPVIMHTRHLPELLKGGFIFGDFAYPFYKLYFKYMYNTADVIICASPYARDLMLEYSITSRLELISNGVNTELFKFSERGRQGFREKYGFSENDLIIFSVGLMIPRKGVETFFDVAKKFEDIKDIKFVWIGEHESMLQKVSTKVNPSNTFFIDYVPFDDMVDVYSGGDMFFFPYSR